MNKFVVRIIATVALFRIEAAVASVSSSSEERLYTVVEDTSVVFTSCDSIRICGTLTTPKKCKNFPTVILISGSGKQNRDGDMAGHSMFRDIAHHLSARGIAVLRMDDRGTGQSTGHYEYATTADFAADALAAFEYLKDKKGINKERIGLLGHSEGAAAACIVAAQNKEVAFVISLAGLLSDGLSSVISQNYDLVEASSMKERDKQRYHQIMALMARTAYDYADSDSLQTKIYERHDIWKSADNSRFKALWGDEQDTFRFPVWFYANDASRKWYRFFIRYNPADYMKHISVPFLAINGEKDAMVNAKLNLGTAQKLMEHNPHFQTLLLPGLNHLLLPCEKGTPDEYRSIKAPLSSEVLKAVEEFILSPRIP